MAVSKHTVFALIYGTNEINNRSNRSNGQVLLSFIFSCYNVSRSYYQLLPMERYVAGNLQSAWNEWRAPSPSVFISPPCSVSQKMPGVGS